MAGEDSYRYMMQRVTTPWANSKPGGGLPEKHPALKYRGWTLVDIGSYRWAINDRNCNKRGRICKADGNSSTFAAECEKFHAYVDSVEDGD